MNRVAALLSILALMAAQGSKIVACACAPCPLEAGGMCEKAPPPCCEEPEPEESCSCSHFDAPEAVPPDVVIAEGAAVVDLVIPSVAEFEITGQIVAVTPRGPDPPPPRLPIYLRDLTLRL